MSEELNQGVSPEETANTASQNQPPVDKSQTPPAASQGPVFEDIPSQGTQASAPVSQAAESAPHYQVPQEPISPNQQVPYQEAGQVPPGAPIPPSYTTPPGGPQGPKRKENIVLPIISFVLSFLFLILSWVTSVPHVFMVLAFFGIIFAVVALVLNWKRKKVLSIIAVAAASVVFLASGAAVFVNSLKDAVVYEDSRKETTEESDDSEETDSEDDTSGTSTDVKDYIADPDDYTFKWTVKNFKSLEFAGYDAKNGTDIKTILKKYGKASNAEISDSGNRFSLEYQATDNTDYKTVNLEFEKQYNGKIILVSGSAYGFETDVVETTSEDSYKSTWSKSDIDSLKVGDATTGVGGSSLKDIIKKHGNPTRALISVSNYGDGFEERLQLNYLSSTTDTSKENYVALDFVKSEDSDDYLLIYKYPK
ncbi:MFS transporter [Streptococcus ferus]|uniref:MFS transporter n=1 Tax=Streptococcus ferus TaxID=1345 RepID=UPI0023568D34|nr:MFS transporter [Streptococcus ferus]